MHSNIFNKGHRRKEIVDDELVPNHGFESFRNLVKDNEDRKKKQIDDPAREKPEIYEDIRVLEETGLKKKR
jgi:hypothetical protein